MGRKRDRVKRVGWQFIKFGMVGATSTIINAGLYMILVQFVGIWPTISNCIGYTISTYNGYYWQTKFVFGGERGVKRFFRVFLAYLPGLVISTLLIKWLTTGFHYAFIGLDVNGLGVPKIWAQIPTLFITVPINCLLQKMWAYKDKPAKTEVEIQQKVA